MSGGSGGSAAAGAGGVSLTTKGDLLTFDTAETRLPVNLTNGFVLTTNSAVADGIEWAVLPAAAVTLSFVLACSDETSDLTTGTKVTFRMPYNYTLTDVRASLTTAATGANLTTVDIQQGGTTVLSTKITIDASETTSTTAATPPVISTSALTNDSIITIIIDQIGNTTAGAGLKVYLIGTT
jgi:hypothetical protein